MSARLPFPHCIRKSDHQACGLPMGSGIIGSRQWQGLIATIKTKQKPGGGQHRWAVRGGPIVGVWVPGGICPFFGPAPVSFKGYSVSVGSRWGWVCGYIGPWWAVDRPNHISCSLSAPFSDSPSSHTLHLPIIGFVLLKNRIVHPHPPK